MTRTIAMDEMTKALTEIANRASNYGDPDAGDWMKSIYDIAKAALAAPPPCPQNVMELLKRAQRTIERDYPNGQLAIDIRAALSTNPGEQE